MEKINLTVDIKSKEFMFNLGMIFASGARISVANTDEIHYQIIEEEKNGFAKSFNMMIKYWADNNLSADMNVESKENNLFLICPVRNATEAEKENLNKIIVNYENQGFKVHYPERDTNQNPYINGVNTGGYNICLQNARALANAKTVSIFYNKSSTGSMFDLGVTYYLQKRDNTRKFLILNNEVVKYEEDNYIDNKILELISEQLTV